MRSPLSMQEGNYLRHGEDGGIYADGNDLLSNESDNILGISKVDGKIYLSHEDYVTTVSKENGNVLRPGADGGALLLIEDLISKDAQNSIVEGSDKLLYVRAVSKDKGNAVTPGSDLGSFFPADFGTM